MLDVGCGYGRWAHLLKSNYWEANMAQPPTIDGVDAFGPNVEHCRASGVYRRVWEQLLPGELHGTWDTVLACEIIEHIPQESVEETLDLLESVARRRVIISTPNYHYLRDGADTVLGFNDHEAHLSYSPRSFFRQRGYTVVGAGFGNPNHWLVRLLVRLFQHRAKFGFQSLPVFWPATAACIVAFKNVN